MIVMKHTLLDTSINRLMGTYDSEAEALAYVRALLKVNDATFADDLALSAERSDGSFTKPVTGADLVARAEDVDAERDLASVRTGDVMTPRGGSRYSEPGEAVAGSRMMR